MLIGYARVSSSGQSLEVQQEQLRDAGCEEVFSEKRSGGTRDGREELDRAIKFCRTGDTLIVTRLDRLARSGKDLYEIVDQLSAKGASFRCLQQGAVDTTTSMGKLVLGILGAVAEFEKDIRAERQAEGIAKVKEAHPERYRGRRPTVDKEAIRALAGQGMGATAIAKQLGYGRRTIYRALEEQA
jgi:DNA invertase Pin-like site-specific DNA recombinase